MKANSVLRKKDFHQDLESVWSGINDVLLTSQIILRKVYRWSRFSGVRKQNVLQHSYSVVILAKIMVEKLDKYVALDKELILTSFLVHDHGEGELIRDICYDNKKTIDDLDEYLAFIKRYGQLDKNVFSAFNRAYLLQYCLSEKNDFPLEAQEIMKEMRVENHLEALIFEAVEVWEYLLYSLEQDKKSNNKIILHDVYKTHIERMEQLSNEILGFKEEIWTKKVSDLFHVYLK